MNFDSLDINSIATLISCFLSAYFGFKVSCYSAKNPLKLDIYKKQLKFVYTPLFKEIQPYMYKEISLTVALHIVSKFNKIKHRNFELINPNLISAFVKFENELKSKNVSISIFQEICYIIDTDFEYLRKSLFLPSRNLLYRYKNNEKPNNFFSIHSLKLFFSTSNIYVLCVLLALFIFLIENVILNLINY